MKDRSHFCSDNFVALHNHQESTFSLRQQVTAGGENCKKLYMACWNYIILTAASLTMAIYLFINPQRLRVCNSCTKLHVSPVCWWGKIRAYTAEKVLSTVPRIGHASFTNIMGNFLCQNLRYKNKQYIRKKQLEPYAHCKLQPLILWAEKVFNLFKLLHHSQGD